jgi:hypothetical protein
VSTPSLRSAAVAVAAARLAYGALCARPPGGPDTWTRTNHRGEPITLLEGPAVAAGGVAGAVLAGGLSGRQRAAMAVAAAGAAGFGGYDDLAGSSASKGFRGHLGALSRGQLTTGALKIAGIGATGLAAALLAGPRAAEPGGTAGTRAAAADAVINAGLVAGGANLLNLFDLRPGRAIKVAIAAGALIAVSGRGRQAVAAPLAAAAALLPEDLGERSMLGDAGANAIGAMLGVAAAGLPRPARIGALAGLAGLTAASEVVSFTSVIERSGPLRWLDLLGRRPAPAEPAQPAAPAGPAPAEPARPASSAEPAASAQAAAAQPAPAPPPGPR